MGVAQSPRMPQPAPQLLTSTTLTQEPTMTAMAMPSATPFLPAIVLASSQSTPQQVKYKLLRKALDFETATSHSLTARASDGSQDDIATVTISVANINDNTPIIANNNQTIAENAAAGTSIINLNDAHTGTDNDRDGNAINYTLQAEIVLDSLQSTPPQVKYKLLQGRRLTLKHF